MMLVRARPTRLRLRPDNKLVFTGIGSENAQLMNAVTGLLDELEATLKTPA